MLVASSVSPSSALFPLPCGVLKRSFCLPSAAVALLPCACRSPFHRVCRPTSAQSVSSRTPVRDWRHHLCLSILFLDGRCQIEVMSKPSSAAEWLTSSDEFIKKVADKEQTDSINSGLYEAKHGASSSVNSQGGHLNLPAPPPGLTEQDRTDRLRCFPTLFHVCCPHHKSCRYCEATCCRTDPAHTSHRCRVHLHW